MAKINRFKTDREKETRGVWVEAGEGLELLIARLPNPSYRQRITELTQPIRHKIRHGLVEPEELKKIEDKAIARHVLLGWRNLQDENDKDVPYTEQQALAYLQELPEFRRLVVALAQDGDLFRDGAADAKEEDELGKRRRGTPSGAAS